MRLLITEMDIYGNETGTRRAWLEDLLRDPDIAGDMVEINLGGRA